MSMPAGFKRNDPAAVYQVFGRDNELLYIGCSTAPLSRVMEHTKMKHWAREVTRVDVEWFDTWHVAREHEKARIAAEVPRWNVMEQRDKAARDAARTSPRHPYTKRTPTPTRSAAA